jgi:DMSO reductase anchor subunit
MNPAFSVILFTALSGAGYGLLAWLGVMICCSRSNPIAAEPSAAHAPLALILVALATGIVLTTIGLLSSTFHLGKPLRAWRAFSQWRTSWLSREGVLAMLTFVPALGLAALCSTAFFGRSIDALPGGVVPWAGGTLALLSLLTVACTAMIYASLKPVPAWRHRLVVPVYLAFALLTGSALFIALAMTASASGRGDLLAVVSPWSLGIPAALATALAAMKLIYWRDIDRLVLPSREAATALEGYGKLSTFERPHTEANYLTHEMGFVLARKHSRKLRALALLLFAGVPLLALLLASLVPFLATSALWIAVIAAIAGAFVERWLFFAEAKHLVMLYY